METPRALAQSVCLCLTPGGAAHFGGGRTITYGVALTTWTALWTYQEVGSMLNAIHPDGIRPILKAGLGECLGDRQSFSLLFQHCTYLDHLFSLLWGDAPITVFIYLTFHWLAALGPPLAIYVDVYYLNRSRELEPAELP